MKSFNVYDHLITFYYKKPFLGILIDIIVMFLEIPIRYIYIYF